MLWCIILHAHAMQFLYMHGKQNNFRCFPCKLLNFQIKISTTFLSYCHIFFSSIEAFSLSFLSKTLSWWWSFSFHGLFPSGWCLLSPLLLYLSLHLHGGKSPLKDLIEAQRSSLHKSFTSKLSSLFPLSLTLDQFLHLWYVSTLSLSPKFVLPSFSPKTFSFPTYTQTCPSKTTFSPLGFRK